MTREIDNNGRTPPDVFKDVKRIATSKGWKAPPSMNAVYAAVARVRKRGLLPE